MKWQVTAKLSNFQGDMVPIGLKMSQNIAKFMAYIMNKLGGDFKQGGCLYKSTSGIQ